MNRADIQGLLFSGYSAQKASALLLIRFGDGRANAWLRRLLPQVSSGADAVRREPFRVNVAFTHRGLAQLRLPKSTLDGFSREFRQGMAHPERSAALGDRAGDEPSAWDFSDGAPGGVDALVLVYAPSSGELESKLDELERSLARFELEFERQLTYLPSDGREHFGFRMGVSEPGLRGARSRRSPGARLANGEFLLGHADGAGDRQRGPVAPVRRSTRETPPLVDYARAVDFGFNGSYLVVRKFEQRLEAFQAFFAAQGQAAPLRAAQLVGRWPNGASLALHPDGPPLQTGAEPRFSYRAYDPKGHRCPLGAHVRRANPRDSVTGDARDSDRHRLLRRGRLFGPPALADGAPAERGLLFLALNADIERQFEYVHASWLASGKFAGLRDEPDPLLGHASSFSLPGEPSRRRLLGLPQWVRVRGGLYSFLPSLRALGYLADLDPPAPAL